MISILISYANKINHAEIAPVGIAQQWQVNHDGSLSEKFRLCHDQSVKASAGASVNKRVLKDELLTSSITATACSI